MKKIKQEKGISYILIILIAVLILLVCGILFSTMMKTEENDINIEKINENKIENNVQQNEDKEWSDIYTKTTMDNYVDSDENTATIPEGFQVSLKEGETKINDGLVVRDAESKNEFVWIPCNKQEIDFESQDLNKSVKAFGGFYISRYEAGVENGELSTTDGWHEESMLAYEPSWTGWIGTDIKLVSKKDAYIWNYITINKAEELATKMYKGNEDITSDLISNEIWNHVLKFTGDTGSNRWGNYVNSSFEINSKNAKLSIDGGITYEEAKENKIAGNTYLYTAGASEQNKIKQIYDLAGNVWEFNKPLVTTITVDNNTVENETTTNTTTEPQIIAETKYICTGGSYKDMNKTVSSSFEVEQFFANIDLGFRVVLYINN